MRILDATAVASCCTGYGLSYSRYDRAGYRPIRCGLSPFILPNSFSVLSGLPLFFLGFGQGASASSGTLKIEGAWVKASKGGMTGVFGKITNSGDKPVKITSASSTATDTVQLHTTTKGSDGGTKMEQVHEFTIEPGATLELKPGGDHIMLMDMSCSLAAGGATTVTVKTEDGASLEFKPVARDYQGAKEEYKGEGSAPATADASASGHDHSHSHDGHDHSHEGHDHEHGGSSASGSASADEHADHDHGEGSHEHSHGAAGASESPLPECK